MNEHPAAISRLIAAGPLTAATVFVAAVFPSGGFMNEQSSRFPGIKKSRFNASGAAPAAAM